ncbi:hypothetical protein NicSoilE8_41880 (plasmid) [Arthrobacter sp. NicSoilE8]|nr:hypothetical protein NicSoilE8_41880 [Arthrobacter sp. NicSoilE8]
MKILPQKNRRIPVRTSLVTFGIALSMAAALVAVPAASADGLPPSPGTVPVPGASIVGQQWLTQRTLELTVASPSFTAPVKVEVILPTGYATAAPAKGWPVTYYTDGTAGTQANFRALLNGEQLTASYPSIVVAPSGNSGYWSDWSNNGAGGPPMYETFVTQQLIPLIDANFRTTADRSHRGILGGSMGGYGALMLAARHPDLFAAAASLSGAVDTNWAPGSAVLSVSPALDLAIPDSIYGPRLTNEVTWRGHNPTDLAGNLSSLDLQLYTGNGIPGAQELANPLTALGCPVESGAIYPETQSLHGTLTGLGIRHTFSAYNWGCHTPEMFQKQISEALPHFAEIYGKNVPAPTTFDYRSIEPSFSVFGWSVDTDPLRATEFLDLHDVSNTGFTVTGSGSTRITTPPMYLGNKAVTVLIDGVAKGLRTDSSGRLTIPVTLGTPDQDQQYTLGAVTSRQTSVVSLPRR